MKLQLAISTTMAELQISFNGHYQVKSIRSKSNHDHHSTISSMYLFPDFPEAAFNKVLIASTILPCFPMTLPISSLATLSSNTVVWLPSISFTSTCSGLSTSAFTIWIRNSFMGLVLCLGDVTSSFV